MEKARGRRYNGKGYQRNNIIIKGIETKKGKRKEAVEEIMNEIRVRVDIKEIRRVGERTDKERGEMLLIKLVNEEQKWGL